MKRIKTLILAAFALALAVPTNAYAATIELITQTEDTKITINGVEVATFKPYKVAGTGGGTVTVPTPTNPQPAEPAPTAAPPANGGGTQPSGGTGAAPPTGQG